jgi:hypothetical protein
MSRISTTTQTTSKTTAVTSNKYDGVIQTVPLTDSADSQFVFEVDNKYVQRVSTILLSTEYSSLTGNTSDVITLTGSSGTANVTIGGTNYLATFATDLATTVTNFYNTNKTAIETATGGTLSKSGATLTLLDATIGYPTITVTNVSGNLAGSVASTAVATTGLPIATLESYSQGLFKVRVSNVGTQSLNSYVRIMYKLVHN